MLRMKEFLAYIVKNLVDKPEEVHLKEVQGTNTIIYELTVAKGDIGKIIGKEGRTIKAIRTLLVSVASRDNVKVSLEIMEER
ncbi:RNA binding protein [Chlamydia trachomatis A2497]|nr:RNA binding protein [Chlamydia trachomatis D-EC]ADI52348.1 RNA binding protein [Chlamydia trachomatis D-LC]AEP35540.1 RNA binding protein [Chlamydia trachomatis A2497]